ncbi:MAG: CDP-diacylglycerol--serine O-phosphatidyltransferase [Endomicrobium sp.]|jgi:CDP-diacylglycerol--serine O-phosphatidyltransferase|nr:CDP-diacylglycerol--serine O-phosphatidyltransferase [Endomicrobium sp.]
MVIGKLKKSVYILASLFTCGNIICGCWAIILLIDGSFSKAAWFIMLAVVFDMVDGRVARITKTTSDFGVQLDSLSDLVSFGVAPAIMMYRLILGAAGKIGIAVTVLFVVCSAWRLARFNVMAGKGVSQDVFLGLPTPASAGLLGSFVLSYELFIAKYSSFSFFVTMPFLMKNTPMLLNIMFVVMVALSLLMVLNIPYASFKKLKFSRYKIFGFLVLIVLFACTVFAFAYVQSIIFILFFLYVLSGLFVYIGVKSREILKKFI